ncbi:MAG: 5-formyltetrahydrofolate cyclo-ligase, partial [Chitinophagaceae bacterium]
LSDLNMESVEYNEVSELKKNVYGISEPVDGNLIAIELLDMVLMPLLAFDLDGNRVGFGKGYYDRFLKSCRRDIVKIGLSFLDPLDKISDINSYDIPMDFCITPKMTYAFH